LESQRVRCLTEGYLRGWLPFEYSQRTSIIREELILNYIEDQRLYDLLQHKLFVETVLRSSLPRKDKSDIDAIFKVSRSLIGLKLPSAMPEDTIKNNEKQPISPEQIAQWKAELAGVAAEIARLKAVKK